MEEVNVAWDGGLDGGLDVAGLWAVCRRALWIRGANAGTDGCKCELTPERGH